MGRSHDLARGASSLYQTQAASDTRYVNTTGDSMTGNLEVDGIIEIDKTGDHPALRFVEDGSNTRGYMGSGDWAINGLANDDFGISSSSTGDLVLGTGAGTERLRLNNTGPVSMASQPAFRAWAATIYSSVGVMTFPNVTQKGGNNYNTTSGLFTAPIAGWYFFNFHYLTHSTGTRNDTYFVKNGGVFVEQRNYKSSGNHETHSLTAVDYLAANDTIGVRNVTGDVYAYQTWTSYYGFYLG